MSCWTKETGVRVWDFKGKEGNSQEDEKEQVFAEQMFALLCRDNGTERRFNKHCAGSLCVCATSSFYATRICSGSALQGQDPLSKFF